MIEVSHWHTSIYVKALMKMKVSIVGVSDRDENIARKISSHLDCKWYQNYQLLINNEKPDFVFAFGRHCEMPSIAEYLIKKQIPFAMEKPMGVTVYDIENIMKMNKRYRNFIAVPFVFRYSPIINKIECLKSLNIFGKITHLYFRFIAGPPTRYLEANSAWMLDSNQAGGGCTINLAVHFIDLFYYLVGSQNVKEIYAALSNLKYKTDIEDFSTIVLRTNQNVICIIETGYAYPVTTSSLRDIDYCLTTTNGYLEIREEELRWFSHDGKKIKEKIGTATEDYYPVFIERTLEAYRKNKKPSASINEMYKVMKIVDAAYKSNKSKKIIKL